MISRRIFDLVKKSIPKISSTELIALNSGTTSIDRSILEGRLTYPPRSKHSEKFSKDELDTLLSSFDGSKIFPNDNNNYWINYLGKNKYFSFLIDEQFGGIKLSVNELSNILTKITSVDPALGVVAMVPNSLGPGELLINYGSEKQKQTHLPKLASGESIPCFGLTGPTNGSDATGTIDKGRVILDDNGNKVIEITINKRYITLAPVANLIGLAFELEDPYELLDTGKEGVTVALLERGTCGLIQESYHNPLNAGFPNGTLKGDLMIPIDNIIGGEKNAGEGWKMLMDCLAAGRGVSLPATANASSKVATFGMFHYMQLRKQFKLPLSSMQAVQEKFNNMVYHTWVIQCAVAMTNDILDGGEQPAVVSAIMKQQCTERGRIVLNEAMDIHAGASICLGYSNFLEKYYKSAPIGITVEGSNTLTRSLIIFGQGLNKSHPHIFPILTSILENDKSKFQEYFKNIVDHSLKLYFKSFGGIGSLQYSLEQQIIDFACLTNFVALKGGALKREQMLSGDMADIFSNLYLAISVKYAHKNEKVSDKLTNYVIQRLMNENIHKINKVVDNLSFERVLLCHMKRKPSVTKYHEEKNIFEEVMQNEKILTSISKNIHIHGVLKDMETAIGLDENSEEYREKLHKIINVGEWKK